MVGRHELRGKLPLDVDQDRCWLGDEIERARNDVAVLGNDRSCRCRGPGKHSAHAVSTANGLNADDRFPTDKAARRKACSSAASTDRSDEARHKHALELRNGQG